MNKPSAPRLLILRDPQDGRTVRLQLAERDGRYFVDIDSGTAFDGTTTRDRWHGSEAGAIKDIDDLRHRYEHAGYQLVSDRAASLASGATKRRLN